MRYEAMRLLQFVFSLSLVLGAFIGGLFVGWRRWGRRGPVDHSAGPADLGEPHPPIDLRFSGQARHDLFAPESDIDLDGHEVDLQVGPPSTLLGLPTGTPVVPANPTVAGTPPDR